MGMYDNLRIEVPLPNGRKPSGPQTKDFGCLLKTHIITAEGRLMVDETEMFEHPERMVDSNFHGILHFCDSDGDPNNDTWRFYEYEAKFTDGKLIEITVVTDED